jgi:hypothetical protein
MANVKIEGSLEEVVFALLKENLKLKSRNFLTSVVSVNYHITSKQLARVNQIASKYDLKCTYQ